MNKTLIIVNSVTDNFNSDGIIYAWTGYDENQLKKSLLRYVEENGNILRDQYLEFIHDLGEFKHKNTKIREHFLIGKGASLWWMSLIAEKSPYKSNRIIDCLRLLAIEKILIDQAPEDLVFCVNDASLAKTIKNLCGKLGIKFYWRLSHKRILKTNFFEEYIIYLYIYLKGFAYLLYYFFSRYKLRNGSTNLKTDEGGSVFFSSYFFNLDLEIAKKGEYYSRQWGELPSFLNQTGQTTTHLENYVKSPGIPDCSSANKILKLLNKKENIKTHIFLDSKLSLGVFLKVLFQYFKLNFNLIGSNHVRDAFDVKGSELNFCLMLRRDWYCSFAGKTAISNLIWIQLFERHLRQIPYQKVGFYICENMGWERALIAAWNNNHHGTLIAVPHSTIRFWDLRYFSDPRINQFPDRYSQPVPDYYALNGEMAWTSFVKNNYLNSKLLKSEALRYQFLAKHIATNPTKTMIKAGKYGQRKKVLILGDFKEKKTDLMLQDLEKIAKSYDFSADYILKPHPVSNINVSNYPMLNLTITDKPLHDIASYFDIVFSSNTTSASVDCFLMNMKVIIFMDDGELNFSPMRNIKGVDFVCNLDQLYQSLDREHTFKKSEVGDHIFWIDPELPKWKKIISKFSN